MGYPRDFRSIATAAVVVGCGALLAGCDARTNVGATGTAPENAAHLWVTVEELWFASDADTLPESETGWTREKLSNPVVLDLANLDAGKLVSLATNVSLPSGDYRQLHLKLADPADRLVNAARDTGLDYNAQIDVKSGSGAVSKRPLEFPVPGAGLTIPVQLTFKDNSSSGGGAEQTTNLAVTIDAARDVVTYEYGSNTGYILSPDVSVHDVSKAGAITGSVDTSGLAADHPPVYVSAQERSGAGTHHVVVQRRRVAADGTFELYPLPAAKNGAKLYDIVISCAAADAVIVRDVPVTADGTPTSLQPAAVVLTPARTVYADTGTQTPALPAGTRVEFYQSPPGSEERPYLIDGTALDPLTRHVPGKAFALAAGSLVVGTYASGNAITLATTSPAEGTGGYVVGSSGLYRAETLASRASEVTGGRNRPTEVIVPDPQVADGGRAGTIVVTITAAVSRYDNGFITVMAGSEVIETVDVGSLLERGGGIVTIGGLPAGSALAPVAGVPYRIALRAWNSRNPSGSLASFASERSVSLGDNGTGSLVLQVQ
jgi:hypothetical protein